MPPAFFNSTVVEENTDSQTLCGDPEGSGFSGEILALPGGQQGEACGFL